jgi:hypothetical protein
MHRLSTTRRLPSLEPISEKIIHEFLLLSFRFLIADKSVVGLLLQMATMQTAKHKNGAPLSP